MNLLSGYFLLYDSQRLTRFALKTWLNTSQTHNQRPRSKKPKTSTLPLAPSGWRHQLQDWLLQRGSTEANWSKIWFRVGTSDLLGLVVRIILPLIAPSLTYSWFKASKVLQLIFCCKRNLSFIITTMIRPNYFSPDTDIYYWSAYHLHRLMFYKMPEN